MKGKARRISKVDTYERTEKETEISMIKEIELAKKLAERYAN